jgi:hypothetical protein
MMYMPPPLALCEGKSLRALPVEGATLAPLIAGEDKDVTSWE